MAIVAQASDQGTMSRARRRRGGVGRATIKMRFVLPRKASGPSARHPALCRNSASSKTKIDRAQKPVMTQLRSEERFVLSIFDAFAFSRNQDPGRTFAGSRFLRVRRQVLARPALT